MSRPWMPLYIADYLADTAHLSAGESGAYLHLIMHYWQRGNLPTDPGRLCRIAKMTEQEWTSAQATVEALFEQGWKHSRIEAEIELAEENIAAKVKAGKKGGKASVLARKAKRIAETQATVEASLEATVQPAFKQNSTPSPSPPPSSKEEEPLASLAVRADGHTRSEPPLKIKAAPRVETTLNADAPNRTAKRGTRVPPDFAIDEADRKFAADLGLPSHVVEGETPQFIDYWAAIPGAKGLKLDWKGTWRNRMRFLKDHQPTSRGPPAVRPLTEFQRGRQELKGILNDLDSFASGSSQSSGENPRLLSRDPGERSETIRGGVGGDVIDLPTGSGRSRG